MLNKSAPEQAFKRHSRPQQPTLPANSTVQTKPRPLHAQSSRSWLPSSLPPLPELRSVRRLNLSQDQQAREAREANVPARSTWVDFFQVGRLTQGATEMIVCTGRQQRSKLFMFKQVRSDDGDARHALLSIRHPNVLAVKHVVSSNTSLHLGFDFVRCTLDEILTVHLPLQEHHIGVIGRSVFAAIKYLHSQGYQHGRISASTIRICIRTSRVYLSDCDECETVSILTNKDLEDLGLLLLDCMEVTGKRRARTAIDVQRERATNKVFGLSDPERWSSSKKLIDFLDDLFGACRRPEDKLDKPHDFVGQRSDDEEALHPLVQLASLECVALWQVIR